MSIEQQFVSAEIALKLKEKGFNEECLAYYKLFPDKKMKLFGCGAVYFKTDGLITNHFDLPLAAPLYQQVIRWLDAKKIIIEDYWNANLTSKWMYQIHTDKEFCVVDCEKEFESRFEMYNHAILKAIELI